MTDLPVVRGEFNLLRKIGEGGMAEVFLAERGGDEGFRTLVALKRLHSGFSLDQYFIRQLVAEARLLGQLQHNNVVRVHDFRRIEDEHFIVMEYIDGIDLAQAIHVHREHGLTMPLSVFFHLALCMCEALDYAHSATDLNGRPMELIHRDIKPSNVLISGQGTVKLTDFGIARVADSTHTGSVVKGTANYMSPEQASGDQDLTPASDIFSLGAVFWETLTLEKLVDGSNYLNVIDSIKVINVGLKDITRRGIEPALRMILLRMLAHKSQLRYQSMALVLKDLRFVADQMKVDLSPAHLQEYMSRIIGLAREAAVRRAEGNQILVPNHTPTTPAPKRETPTEDIPPDDGEVAFQDSVAALQKLVQTGGALPPVADEEPAASSPKAPEPKAAPPAAAPPSAPALKAMPELAQASGIGGREAPAISSPAREEQPLVRRNTASSASEETTRRQPGASSLPSSPALGAVPEVVEPTDEVTLDEDESVGWDEEEELGLGAARRANLMVLAIGAPAVLILIGVIVWLLTLPPPDGEQAVLPAVADEPQADKPENPLREADEGGAGLAADADKDELILVSGNAPVDGWEEPLGEAEPELGGSSARADDSSVGRDPVVERVDRPAPREPEPVADRWEPEPEPEPEPVVDRWEPEPEPEPEPVVDRWEPEPEPVDEGWEIASEDSQGDVVESDAPLSATSLGDMASSARRGNLRVEELERLQAIEPESSLYNSGRALLLAHFEARRDTRGHCEVAVETLRQPANQAAPQFHLEMSKCHLRQGRHQDALESARIAEMNAQDIPARVRADRQLKIWEVQAKAYKGLYQSTDDLDYIADSIAVWKRYLHMANNTYRQRESDRAEREINSLESLQAGAL